jgi:hypothetical protein
MLSRRSTSEPAPSRTLPPPQEPDSAEIERLKAVVAAHGYDCSSDVAAQFPDNAYRGGPLAGTSRRWRSSRTHSSRPSTRGASACSERLEPSPNSWYGRALAAAGVQLGGWARLIDATVCTGSLVRKSSTSWFTRRPSPSLGAIST